jgi:hypothetical protein
VLARPILFRVGPCFGLLFSGHARADPKSPAYISGTSQVRTSGLRRTTHGLKRNPWLTAPPSIGELALVFFFSGNVTVSKPTTSELAKDVGHGESAAACTHTCMACDRRCGERAAATELVRARRGETKTSSCLSRGLEEILLDAGRDSLTERTFSFSFRGGRNGSELPRACRHP